MAEVATNVQTVHDLILTAEAAVLATITRANGYQVDVQRVYINHESTLKQYEYPALRLVDQGEAFRRSVGFYYEISISIAVWAFFKESDRDNARTLLRQLQADAIKALHQDEFVDGLAFQTKWQNADPRLNDAAQPDALAVCVGEIGFRHKLDDPYTLWTI